MGRVVGDVGQGVTEARSCRTLQAIIKNLSFILREMKYPLDDFDGNDLA